MDFTRRRFSQLLTALGLAPALTAFAADGQVAGANGGSRDPQILRLSRNGWVPNNAHLPVLLYRDALRGQGEDPAATFEAVFTRNGWPPHSLVVIVADLRPEHSLAVRGLDFMDACLSIK